MSDRYPMPIPLGWYHVAYSNELAPGAAMPIRYFGKDMVLFRTESGEAKVLDAYCPHMGAHLGYGIHEFMDQGGEVRGDTIVCPFHGWRFNGEGECVDVPYAKNMPPKVKGKQSIKPWHVTEENQCIWVWYHPFNEEPMWDVRAVPEAQAGHAEWGDIQSYRFKIRTHIQDIAENGADPAHFHYVHGTAHMPDVEKMEFDGPSRHGVVTSKLHTPIGDVDGRIEFEADGPGQATTRFSGICDTVLLGSTTPIDDEYVEVNFGFIQKKVNGEVPKGGVNAAIINDICQQLREDTPIWEHKIYRPLPVLCDGDGPIAKFRKWYSQFYAEGYSEFVEPDRVANA